MDKIFKLKIKLAFVIFCILDLICIGIGMGVPVFAILFGFVVGWYITRRFIGENKEVHQIVKKIFVYSGFTSLFTFIVMCVIWGPTILWLFDPNADFTNFGHPFILYDPRLSFIGWLILMILISPFLQLLTTTF